MSSQWAILTLSSNLPIYGEGRRREEKWGRERKGGKEGRQQKAQGEFSESYPVQVDAFEWWTRESGQKLSRQSA